MARCRHMAGSRKPTWMPTWCLRGVNSRDKSRNRTVGIKSRNRTVGIISRDWTAEITRSGIRVMVHDPTDYARSNG